MTRRADVERAVLAVRATRLASLPPGPLVELARAELAQIQSPQFREAKRKPPTVFLMHQLEASSTPAQLLRKAAETADSIVRELEDNLSQGPDDAPSKTGLELLLKGAAPQRYPVYADAAALRAAAELAEAQEAAADPFVPPATGVTAR